jgi:predicted dehydrogenase
MKKIRIGIIGVGIIAETHLTKYQLIPECEVVAACDIDAARLDMMCEKYKIPDKYDNIARLLERDDIDAVDVCLHNCLHAPVTIAAMRAGKDVYCEKPMAGSYYDAVQMVEAMRETGRKLHIQLNWLYNYDTAVAKEIIDAGDLGHIYHVRSNGYRRRGRPYVDGYANKEFVNTEWSGGGALFDMGVYYISQLLFLLNNPDPLKITGHIYQETDMDPKRREISRYNVEEFAVGLVDFPGGLSMNITEAWAVHMNKFEGSAILGSKGGIRLNPLSYHTNFHDFQMDSQFDQEAAKYRESTVYAERMAYRDSQRHWIAVLRGECPLLPTAEIALTTQLIQEGIYLSDKLGRQVEAAEVRVTSRSNAREIPNL